MSTWARRQTDLGSEPWGPESIALGLRDLGILDREDERCHGRQGYLGQGVCKTLDVVRWASACLGEANRLRRTRL